MRKQPLGWVLILFLLCGWLPVNTAQAAEGPDAAEEAAISSPRQPETLSMGGFHSCAIQSNGAIACWGWNIFGQTTPPAGAFTQVSAGLYFNCGLRSDGAPVCWGSNDFGQAVPPAGSFTQVNAGYFHACGVQADGMLACWGQNSEGQASPPAGTFTQVSANWNNTCGVKSDGTLVCWGNNDYGKSTPPAGTFTQVGAGDNHTCGIKSDGTIACWGSNSYGQSTPPAGTFTQVSVGTAYTCGLKSDGAITCWGLNNYGQSNPPGGAFTQVSAGNYHTCGLKGDGTLTCWGYNNYNQSTPPAGDFGQRRVSAGRSTVALKSDGTLVSWGFITTPPAGSFSQISAGYGHACGLHNDGTLACVGGNAYGEATPPTATLFTQVSAGFFFTCGLKSEGTATCWGRNDYGQATPPTTTLFTQVSAGDRHACGLKSDGTLTCWGDNSTGQINAPGGQFTQVSAGGYHTCGLKSNGTLACWGYNAYGQINPPAETFTQVNAGTFHTCGVKSNGTLACWGLNTYGQATPPTGTFTQVGLGYYHSCGVKSNGILTCWGDRSFNAYPTITFTPASLPGSNIGVAYSQTLSADGGTAPYSYTLASGSLPPGLTLSPGGEISGIPTTAGAYPFTIQAVDSGFPLGGSQSYTLTINTPPVADSQNISAVEDVPLPITLSALDADGNPLTWTVGSPAHGTLTGTAPALTYTPVLNYFGADSFTFYVNDGSANSNTATVTITVNPVNDAPIAVDDGGAGFSTDENTAFTPADVLANDSDLDGNPFRVTAFNPAAALGLLAWADLPGGALDPGFDGDGKLVTDFGSLETGRAVLIQPDGKIVVAGTSNANFALARYLPDGSLDSGFGSGGKQTTDFGGSDYGHAMALQADGKIVVVGNSYFSTTTNYDLSVARYNPDGSLDASFDGDGKLTTHFSAYDFGYGVLIQPDGKIVVAGYTYSSLHANNDFFLVRYLPNGALDPGFDGDGLLTTDFGAEDYAAAIALQPDGKIIAAGDVYFSGAADYDFALARYNVDGSLDSGFDGDGRLTTSFSLNDFANALALQADGKIVVAGEANADFALARYTPNGALDISFGSGGKLTTDFGYADYGLALALQPDGKMLVAGQSSNGSNLDFSLARYQSNGALDASFDGDGKLLTDLGNNDSLGGIALQADSKVVAAGTSNDNFVLARYTPGEVAFPYDPNGQFETLDDGEIATDTFTYTISDGILSATATVSITIHGVNDAPLANGQAVTTDEDSAKAISLVASDVEGDSLAWTVGSPAHGVLSGSAPALTYTPALNYFGADSFTFYVNDGTLNSNVATVTLTVTPVNDGPLANGQTVTTDEDSAKAISLVASDVEGDSLAWTVGSPAHGILSGTAPALTYTPALNYNGPDSFTFYVNDGTLNSNVATVTIIVTPVNDAPLAVDDAYQIAEDTPLLVAAPGVLANDLEVDPDGIIAVLVSSPAHGKLALLSGGSFTYIPDPNFNGTDSFIYRMVTFPAKTWVDEATVTLTVTPVNDAPVAPTIPDVEWLARAAHNYPIPAFVDVDGDLLTYTATVNSAPLPAWLILNPDTGAFSGILTNDHVGAYFIVVTAEDGLGGEASASFTLRVTFNPFLIYLPTICR